MASVLVWSGVLAHTKRVAAPSHVRTLSRTAGRFDVLLLAAPATALAAGIAAEWLDFRALRYPLLLMVALGVMVTARALLGPRFEWQALAVTAGVGMAAWGAAETVYVVLHVAQGERFSFEAFDSQPAQAAGLIALHAILLGLPTGLAAGAVLAVFARILRA